MKRKEKEDEKDVGEVQDEDALMSVSADRFEGWVFLTEMNFLSSSALTGDRWVTATPLLRKQPAERITTTTTTATTVKATTLLQLRPGSPPTSIEILVGADGDEKPSEKLPLTRRTLSSSLYNCISQIILLFGTYVLIFSNFKILLTFSCSRPVAGKNRNKTKSPESWQNVHHTTKFVLRCHHNNRHISGVGVCKNFIIHNFIKSDSRQCWTN